MIVDSKDISVGDEISFKSINTYDNNLYTGHVVAFGDYSIAKGLYDVVTDYFEITKVTTGLPAAEESTYVIVKLTNGDIMAIATDWVEATTLTIITVLEHQNIVVYNRPIGEVPTILQLLRDNGYACDHVV